MHCVLELLTVRNDSHTQRKTEEGYIKKINELEFKDKQRQTHVTTCMTTIHCLVSELQEIFNVQKIVAVNDTSVSQTQGSAEGVVYQLFNDIFRMFRAIAFGVDGTLMEGDCLTAATLLENRELRAALQGKELELARRKATTSKMGCLEDSLSETTKNLEVICKERDQAQQRVAKLQNKIHKIMSKHDRDSQHIEHLLSGEATHQRQADEWQAMVDKTVVETELMKAHARGLAELLDNSRKDVSACKRQLEQQADESAALESHTRKLETQIEALKTDLKTAAHETRLLTQHTDNTEDHTAPPTSSDTDSHTTHGSISTKHTDSPLSHSPRLLQSHSLHSMNSGHGSTGGPGGQSWPSDSWQTVTLLSSRSTCVLFIGGRGVYTRGPALHGRDK